MYIGSNEISKIYQGSNEISKIYQGTTIIYSAGSEPPNPYPTTDLVVYYKMESLDGYIGGDLSSIYGMEDFSGIGIVGRGLVSHGGDAEVYIPSNTIPDQLLEEISISFWFKPTDIMNYYNGQLLNFSYVGSIDLTIEFGNMYLDFMGVWESTLLYLDASIWSHVVLTFDNYTSNTYINGVLNRIDNIFSGIGEPIRSGDTLIANGGIMGVIDEIAIWNRVLSISEVQLIYDNGNCLVPY
jgi:hypothetical protein